MLAYIPYMDPMGYRISPAFTFGSSPASFGRKPPVNYCNSPNSVVMFHGKLLRLVVPQFRIAKLVNITPITWVYGRYTYTQWGLLTFINHYSNPPTINPQFINHGGYTYT